MGPILRVEGFVPEQSGLCFFEFGISVAKLRRAHGGCLGVKCKKGVEVCDIPGEVDKQAMIPGFPIAAD